MNLEKEIEKYYYDNFAFLSSVHIPTLDILTAIAKHFVEWQKERDHDACRTCEKSRDAVFYKGMEYAKDQMKKESVDGYIYQPNENYFPEIHGQIVEPPFGEKKFHHGDKIKLIILKEDENRN